MSNPLEKSLDDIIGENKPKKQHPPRSAPRKPRAPRDTYRPASNIPEEIKKAAGSRPLLKVKNIHSDLNGEDLSSLFLSVAPVDFVKFHPKQDSVAYICFQYNQAENNSLAVAKFDGRKAMRKILIVENATSLADRINVPARDNRDVRDTRGPQRAHPRRERQEKRTKPKKARPQKKSVEDLDAELNAYMNASAEPNEKPEEMALD